MATIGNLNIKIGADISGAVKNLRSLSASVDKTVQKLSSFESVAKTIGGVAGVSTGLRAFAEEMHGIIETSNKADALGTTIEKFSALREAADDVRISSETFEGAFTKFTQILGDAASGSESAQKAFDGLGLSAKTLSRMDTGDAFLKVADAVSQIPDAASRASAAVDLFGRAGASLLPMFAGGAAGIRQAMEDAANSGEMLTSGMVGTAADATAAIRDLSDQLGILKRNIALAFAPVATGFLNSFVGGEGSARLALHWSKVLDIITNLGRESERTRQAAMMLDEVLMRPKSIARPAKEEDPAAVAERMRNNLDSKPNQSLLAFIEDLNKQLRKLNGLSDVEIRFRAIDADKVNAGNLAKAKELADQIAEAEQEKKAAADQAAKDKVDVQWAQQFIDPMEKVQADVTRLWDMFWKGLIDVNTLERGVKFSEKETDRLSGKTAREEALANSLGQTLNQTLTPLERAAQQLEELKKLEDAGLAPEIAQRRRMQIADEWDRAEGNQPQFAGAAEWGSREAYQAMIRHQAQPAEKPEVRLMGEVAKNAETLQPILVELKKFNDKWQEVGAF